MRGREPLIAAGLTLLFHGCVLVFGSPGVLAGRLVDPDCYVRLMRIERLVTTGAWWDGLMPLLNAPQGLVMHWTRLFDLVVLAFSLPLLPFMDLHQALFWGGALTSPLLQVPAAMLIAWAGRAYVGGRGSLLAVVLFLVQPGIYGVYQVGRADHHCLLLTLAVAVLALLLTWAHRCGVARHLPLLAGIAAAAGLWVGTEALMTIAVAGGSLALGWLLGRRDAAAALWHFALGLLLASVLALLLERPPAEWTAVELDRLSLVHGVLVILLAGAAGLVALAGRNTRAGFPVRLTVAAAGALLVLVPLGLLFPQFFAGPYGEIDPANQAVFLQSVREAEPMLARGATTWAEASFALGGLLFALPFAVAMANRPTDARRLGWLVLLVAMALYLAATLYQMRVLAYVETALVIPWAGAVVAAARQIMTRLARPWRAPGAALAVIAMLASPAVAGGLLVDPAGRAASAALVDRCDWPSLHAWLARSEAPRGPVATYVFPGPWLAWASGRGVVSAPYHRNAAGILDVDRLFRAGPDQAIAIARERNLGLIVLCPQSPGRGGHAWYLDAAAPGGLYARLAQGRAPAWLVRLDADAPDLADFLVFGVVLP
jgi:asparagine N-glycosylation enzyme membrane subunit Stt3